MRYTWSFFWMFLLVHMATYVVSSMNGIAYNFQTATVLAVIVSLFVYIIAAILPNEPAEGNHEH